jgi:hypothetical protein
MNSQPHWVVQVTDHGEVGAHEDGISAHATNLYGPYRSDAEAGPSARKSALICGNHAEDTPEDLAHEAQAGLLTVEFQVDIKSVCLWDSASSLRVMAGHPEGIQTSERLRL